MRRECSIDNENNKWENNKGSLGDYKQYQEKRRRGGETEGVKNKFRRREREAVGRIETNGTGRDGKVSGANSIGSFIDKLATQNPG